MLLIVSLVLLAKYILAINPYLDICYDDLGCFTTRPPFSTSLARPVALLPASPVEIDTRFYLYTRSNRITPTQLTHKNVNPEYKPDVKTKVIVHGLLQDHSAQWIDDLKDQLLEVEDTNIIVVDWSKGNRFPYTQATANTQLVGAETARLINSLIKSDILKAEDVHIIGHNLGAHVAGYAGERIQNLGRITGLDPAGPYFENTDTKVRLDESDATFVDVIHTDGASTLELGLGLMQKSGHVDFYPNGGKDQPKCATTSKKLLNAIFSLLSISDVDDGLGCSSLASTRYFIDSIGNTDCNYIAYPCRTVDDFNAGKCIRCTARGCNRMGYWASAEKDEHMLFLNTQDADKYPYCLHHYVITLNSNNLESQVQTRGRFVVELHGDVDITHPLIHDDSDVTFRPGSAETRLIESTKYIGEKIISANVKFTKTSNLLSSWLYQNEWSFKSIEINYGDNQLYVKLCPEVNTFNSGDIVRFSSCDKEEEEELEDGRKL